MTTALAAPAIEAEPEIAAPPRPLPVAALRPSPFSVAIYGDPAGEAAGLLDSIRDLGVLVPLVVVPAGTASWEIVSGHRRWACASALGLADVPCQVRDVPEGPPRRLAILEYNRQRRKTFTQSMREADALEGLLADRASRRRRANLRNSPHETECRDSDDRGGRTDSAVALRIGLGGKDLYRQARAVWKAAESGDLRARSGVEQVDLGVKTIHAAYKDLRRRDRFTAGFRPTPYDVWNFRHDTGFGIPHPGSIPPGIIAHTLHYFTEPGALVIDPMAGGGTTIDVCKSMGRRCIAYDLHPIRPDIAYHDISSPLPGEADGCDLVFVDPPYHTMKSRRYAGPGVGETPLTDWVAFLQTLAKHAFSALKEGRYVALLLANQTEKDLPAGQGYLDHAFLGYEALIAAGFAPERRISCPMDGAYLPQHVRRARTEGRMLGQVRDLLVMRKPVAGAAPQWSGSPPASS